jgi:hypothetical protein
MFRKKLHTKIYVKPGRKIMAGVGNTAAEKKERAEVYKAWKPP